MLTEISYPCKIDNSMQPAMVFKSHGTAPAPLLVALHTWSIDHTQACTIYLDFCREHNWNMIFPKYRGPGWLPESCGSDYVVSDLEDAVIFMKRECCVDPGRIYLCGGSGGGFTSLLLAGRHPELWTAVSSWCPIVDLVRWHRECRERGFVYADHLVQACGGDPDTSDAARGEALRRSPATYLVAAAGRVPIEIGTGIHDGHGDCSVPIRHAVIAYNLLAKPEDRISEEDMEFMVREERVPGHLLSSQPDPAFGENTVLVRKESNTVRLTIFEGAHDILPHAALTWLGRQRAGCPIDWTPGSAPSAGKHARLEK